VWIVAAVVAACSSMTTDVVTTVNVAAVSISPLAATVAVGAQSPLQAHVQDPGGNSIGVSDIFWSVQDTTIARISSAGVVTGIAPGSTQVSANANGKSGVATITVEKTPVASVVVTPPHVDASPGVRTQLSAVAYDAAQNPLAGRIITWSTSNAAVATVDANGIMSATGPGTATITATADGTSGTATVTVSQAAVATVAVTPNPLSMSVGQTTQLTATLEDVVGNVLNGRVVSWSSSNTATASVSSQGVVTAVAPGSATITATSEGKSGSAQVTTTNVAVGSVAIQPQGPALLLGSSVQLSAVVRDVNGNVVTGRAVTWSSSNTAYVTVSSSGVATGVTLGDATITATSEGKSGTTLATVIPVPVGSVAISPATASVRAGATTTLTATVKDQNGTVVTNRVVTWTSSNTAVATVADGVVTGVAIGSATITATSEGKSGMAAMTVTGIPVGSVTVSPTTKSLLVTQTLALSVTVKDSTGAVVTNRPVTWTSSDASVATVSTTGVVTAVGAGSATITATSETKSGTCAVTVSLVPVSTVVVQPARDTMFTSATLQLTAVTKDSAGDVLSGRTVTWTTSNAAVATVSSAGLVSATSAGGSATITATSEGKSGTASITVFVPIATITLVPATQTVVAGESTPFTATAKDASGNVLAGRVFSWSSSIPAVASVSTTGNATGTGVGVTTITATAPLEGKSGSATLTVNAGSVTLTPSPDSAYIGQTATLTATARDKSGNPVPAPGFAWSSSAPAVATVSQAGVVTPVAAGSTNIVATLTGQSAQVVFKSLAPVATVTVTPANSSITKNQSVVLQAALADASHNGIGSGRVVVWTASDSTLVTITPMAGAYSATVKGKKAGTVTITATCEGKTGTATVTLTN
jgi:trimeric autotransporter adhesin